MNNDLIAIDVKNITKTYKLYNKPTDRLKEALHPFKKQYHRDFYALDDISFQVKKGETVGILGKNGAGKSTLLKIITGVLTPTAGSVTVNGKIASLLELGAGFNPEYTGLENIYFQGSLMGFSHEEMESKVDAILEFADIGEFIYQPVKMYSSGMFARLAFSVAINAEPEVLIVDEALAVGDAAFQAKCMKKFEEFRLKKITILMVSHDLGAILQFSSNCILIEQGKLIDIHDPKQTVDAFKKLMLSPVNDHSSLSTIHNKNKELLSLLSNAPWASKYKLNYEGAEVYGNSKVGIADIGIFDANNNLLEPYLEFGKSISFKMKINFLDFVNNPIFTLTIRDLTGKEIVGANTLNEKIQTGGFEANRSITVSFTQNFNLAPGIYLLTFACSGFEYNEFVVHQRLYHVLVIEVYSVKSVVGYYDMGTEITISPA